MDESAAGGHPLHAPRHQHSLVTVIVAVTHAPIEHVCDSLEAAMRVIRETRDVVLAAIRAELIQQEERIQIRELRLADDARELDAGPVRSGHAAHDAFNTPRCVLHCRIHRIDLTLSKLRDSRSPQS